jgi:hypothetical protein
MSRKEWAGGDLDVGIGTHALSWTATLGITPGYRLVDRDGEELGRQFNGVEAFLDAWHEEATAVHHDSGIYVPVVVSTGRCVYPGAPQGGEQIWILAGTLNPFYVDRQFFARRNRRLTTREKRGAVIEVLDRTRRLYRQTTAQLTFDDGTFVYLVADEDEGLEARPVDKVPDPHDPHEFVLCEGCPRPPERHCRRCGRIEDAHDFAQDRPVG